MRHGWLRVAALTGAALVVPTATLAATFKVDSAHTSVTFRVRHLFTMVTGRFNSFEGRIVFDENEPLKTRVNGAIDVASINTDNDKRDKHLRSDEFFDAAKYPKITFSTSGKVTDIDRERKTAKLHGTLTMHGVTRPIVLDEKIRIEIDVEAVLEN